jgi:hypothetical protein
VCPEDAKKATGMIKVHGQQDGLPVVNTTRTPLKCRSVYRSTVTTLSRGTPCATHHEGFGTDSDDPTRPKEERLTSAE